MKLTKHQFDKWLIKYDYAVGVVLLVMTAFAVIGAIWLVGGLL